ncbi:hypothetical protein HYW42_02495 [Candidatus Daviesbacteria bacterium]|nr:hypothetical protein [Candidatus Daviesbacteria bacterium]
MNEPITEFTSKLPKLSDNQKKVLKLLIEAARLIVPLYKKQENHRFEGANFYPHDATREEITKAAATNFEILSPYSVVERKGKELIAIPYHLKYAEFLEPIADKLLKAASITDNKDFAKRLEFQANALLNGTYDEATIYWMKMRPYILDINIGPVERYNDKLFFTKTSYQAWVGVMDGERTARVLNFKNIIHTARRKTLMPSEKVDFYEKVQIRVDDLLIFSGLISRTMFLGVNLPNDTNLMEKYGSEITVFKQSIDYRVKTEVLPAFSKVFSSSFQKEFDYEDIRWGTLYFTILHELGHTYLRYRNSERNLEDLFPIIDELSAYVLGMKLAGFLLLKDVLTQKQLESIMVAFTSRCFELVLNESNNKSKIHYTIGGAIFVNFLFETEAIREKEGISWPNFTKMFVSLDQLATILERILSQGRREDAEAFIKKYGDMKVLQRFNI